MRMRLVVAVAAALLCRTLLAATPTVGDATPSWSAGVSGTFSFTFTDPAGYQDLGVLNVLINSALDGRQACYLAYSQPQNVLYLVDDAGAGLSGMALNGGGTLANSQCSVAGAGSGVAAAGNKLTLTLAITFNPVTFSGGRIVYAAARDAGENNSGWQVRGLVSLAPATPSYPAAIGITPSQGGGTQQTFSVTYRDAADVFNLKTAQLLINSALDGRSACYLGYDRANNLLYLVADDGATLLPAVVPANALAASAFAGSGVASNSQCTVSGQGSSFLSNGRDLLLNVSLAFAPGFGGSRIAFAGVQTGTANSGWQALGIFQTGGGPGATLVYPAPNSAGVPLNSRVHLSFAAPVDPASLAGGLTLLDANGNVPGSTAVSADGVHVVFRPLAQLVPGTAYTIRADGVRSSAGVAFAPLSAGFSAGFSADVTPGQVVSTSPGGSNVPINSAIQIQYSKRVDPASLSAGMLRDQMLNQPVPFTIQLSADGATAILKPVSLLAVGRQYSLVTAASDISGNAIPGSVSVFTTGFVVDSARPAFTGAFPANGDTNVPLNARLSLRFDRALNPASLSPGIQLAAAGQNVPVVAVLSADGQTVTLTPGLLLSAGATYTIAISGNVLGLGGGALLNPQSLAFTTGPGPDLNPFSVLSANPAANAQLVATNAPLRVQFNKPVNPLSLTAATFTISANAAGVAAIPGSVQRSADGATAMFVPAERLAPSTAYFVSLKGVQDGVGNSLSFASSFRTAAGADNTPPTILAVAPLSGSSGVAVNARVAAQFSEALDPTTVNAANFSVTQAGAPVAGALTVSADTIQFQPTALLNPQASYTIGIAGIADIAGNLAAPAQATFSTGPAADLTRPSVLSLFPANGATFVDVRTAITFNFSEPVAGPSLPGAISVTYKPAGGGTVTVAGSFSVNGAVVTFVPSLPLPGSASISVSVAGVLDYAGNASTATSSTFTTAAFADATPPVVSMMTPADGATNVSTGTAVVLTFSKPLSPATLTNSTFALLAGTARVNSTLQISADSRTVAITAASLPAGAAIVVVVTSDVTDIAGNHLADFRGQFTTSGADAVAPAVVSQRPANGATGVAPGTAITLVLNKPVDTASALAALHIAQNGAVVAGTASVIENAQAIQFVPAAPLAAGAVVQAFLDSGLRDLSGNRASSYAGQFTVQGLPAAQLSVIRSTAAAVASGVPLNAIIEVEFNLPVDPAKVTSDAFLLRPNGSTAIVAATVGLRTPTIVRLAAGAPLNPGATYVLTVSSAVRGAQGEPFGGSAWLFTTGAAADAAPFAVTSLAPHPGATGVGANATIRIGVNKAFNPVTVTPASVRISAGSATLPASFAFSSDYRTLFVTPQALLPDNAAIRIDVAGVEDLTGLGTSVSGEFSTGAALDIVPPVLLSASVANGATGVPVNTAVSLSFSEAIEPASLNSSTCTFSDSVSSKLVPGAFSFPADLRQATFVPAAPWPVGRNIRMACAAQDLAGNTSGGITLAFTTAFLPDTTAPQVTAISPASALTGVPVNAQIQVLFNEAVQATSLGGVTLSNGAATVAVFPALDNTGQLLTIALSAPLQANTAYTINVSGVKDSAGNTLAAPVASTFTTGAAADLVAPAISFSPANAASGLPTNAAVRLSFNERANPLPLLLGVAVLRGTSRLPLTAKVSDDGKVLTFTPAVPLAANTSFTVVVPAAADLAGNLTANGQVSTSFTTGAAADNTAPTVISVSPPNGGTIVPVNAVIRIQASEPLDPASVMNAVQLFAGAVPVNGTVTLSADGSIVTFTPAAVLTVLSTYSVRVGGMVDRAGNPLPAFSTTFNTSPSAAPDNTAPSLTSVFPANNATNVSANVAIVITFNEPVSPASAGPVTLPVTTAGVTLAGTYNVSANVVTFVPALPLPGNATIVVAVSGVTDLAGNARTGVTSQFTTAPGIDLTPPAITSINPANNAANVPVSAPVVLTFSKPLNPSTVNANSFALFNGSVALASTIVRSADSMTVTLTAALPANATITVAVTHDVTDLAGNHLADFVSLFTTGASTGSAPPSVVSMQPSPASVNVPPSTAITLFFDRAVDPATLPNGVFVSQSGVLVAGTLFTPAANTVQFVPSAPFSAGAQVQVFVTNAVTDLTGVPASGFSTFLFIAGTPSTRPLSVVRTSASALPVDAVIEVEFDAALDAGSIAGATMPVPAAVTLRGDRVLRIQAISLPPGRLELRLSGLIRARDGRVFAGQSFFFEIASERAEVPAVMAMRAEGTSLRIEFTAPINPLSVTSETIHLRDERGAPVPFRAGIVAGDRAIVVTPLAPGRATVTIDGVEGLSGARIQP